MKRWPGEPEAENISQDTCGAEKGVSEALMCVFEL